MPYVTFEVAYSFFKRWANDDPTYPISLLDRWYLTWFLIALFIWRLTTPLRKIVRRPVPLAPAIAVLAMEPEMKGAFRRDAAEIAGRGSARRS